jgi:hypothetical protein
MVRSKVVTSSNHDLGGELYGFRHNRVGPQTIRL